MSLLSKNTGDPTVGSLWDIRRTALRREGFTLVPELGSFLKLREVGVSPYLGFIPSLSTLRMFESSEAVRGRLKCPKPWDQNDMNF